MEQTNTEEGKFIYIIEHEDFYHDGLFYPFLACMRREDAEVVCDALGDQYRFIGVLCIEPVKDYRS